MATNVVLKNILSNAIHSGANKGPLTEIKIIIQFNGQDSTTLFKVRNDGNSITVYNQCISITYSLDNGLYTFNSSLNKNDNEKMCFNPPLNVRKQGNANMTKYTMTDALQVLATKIKLAMTGIVDILKGKLTNVKAPINIEDGATIKSMSISKYRILRGQDTIYEKYGYKSPELDKLKAYIKTLTLGDILDLFVMPNAKGIDVLFTKIRSTPKTVQLKSVLSTVNPETPLTEVLNTISFDDEYGLRPNGIKKTVTLSEVIYQKIKDLVLGESVNPLVLTFNENSDEWKRMRDIVRIISVESIPIKAVQIEPVKGGGSFFKRKSLRNTFRNKTRKNK
jgi:hypothetical protein